MTTDPKPPTTDDLLRALELGYQKGLMLANVEGLPVYNWAGQLVGLYRLQKPKVEDRP